LTPAKMKRFYSTVAVQCDTDSGNFSVTLDGRPVRTPAKAILSVPSRGFADAVAAEWSEQGDEIDLRGMALTTLACTAIDLVSVKRAQIVQEVAAFGRHDLLCYRAETPADLAARQNAAWQPLLDWAALNLDAPLKLASGIVSVAQPSASLESLRRAVEDLDAFDLAALSCAVNASGSLVIGLALRAGRVDTVQALEAAQLDEAYQAERWGEDPDTAQRRDGIAADLAAAARAFEALGV
jgi:chaperone required for assembly of F1-ATPase